MGAGKSGTLDTSAYLWRKYSSLPSRISFVKYKTLSVFQHLSVSVCYACCDMQFEHLAMARRLPILKTAEGLKTHGALNVNIILISVRIIWLSIAHMSEFRRMDLMMLIFLNKKMNVLNTFI